MDFSNYLKKIGQHFPSHPLILKPSVPMTVMILSPHPDDECIMGALALRLMHENNVQVVNVAVTLGSNESRKKARLKELKDACNMLEMELDVLSEEWTDKAKELKLLIQKYQPHLIICPHENDGHPTHIKTAKLLQKVLKTYSGTTLVAWSEFWAQMQKPNCLMEVPEEILHIQMQALTCHAGEIKRNPYHLRLPSWMIDSVRRGGEMIANVGGDAPNFSYGVIYHIQKLKEKKLVDLKLPTSFLSTFADLGSIFQESLEAASRSKTKVKRS